MKKLLISLLVIVAMACSKEEEIDGVIVDIKKVETEEFNIRITCHIGGVDDEYTIHSSNYIKWDKNYSLFNGLEFFIGKKESYIFIDDGRCYEYENGKLKKVYYL